MGNERGMTEKTEYQLNHRAPLLIIISGPSGVGKDAVLQRMKERRLPLHFVVTATTRRARPTEINGVDYIFVTKDEFAEMIEAGKLLEYAVVYEDYKGIPKEQVEAPLQKGMDVIMRIDVQGSASMRDLYPDALLIFLTTIDETELEKRLKERKTETDEGFKLRVATARQELKRINEFDYVVINREFRLEETVDTIVSIIHAEHHRVKHRRVAA
jgi:guanylate kinase